VFVAGNLILALANLLHLVLQAYFWIIIARAVLSWVNPDPFNPIVRFLYRVTEPVLRPIRHRLPTFSMGLDLSPMVVILLIYLLDGFLVATLRDLALSLR
jgi:YggT family protein